MVFFIADFIYYQVNKFKIHIKRNRNRYKYFFSWLTLIIIITLIYCLFDKNINSNENKMISNINSINKPLTINSDLKNNTNLNNDFKQISPIVEIMDYAKNYTSNNTDGLNKQYDFLM